MYVCMYVSSNFWLLVQALWHGGRVCHAGRWVLRIWEGLGLRRCGAQWWTQPGGQRGVSRRSWLGLQKCSWPVRYQRSCRIGQGISMLFLLFLYQWFLIRWLLSILMRSLLYTWLERERERMYVLKIWICSCLNY